MKNFEEGSDRCDLHTGTITEDAVWRKDFGKSQRLLCKGPLKASVTSREGNDEAKMKDIENRRELYLYL